MKPPAPPRPGPAGAPATPAAPRRYPIRHDAPTAPAPAPRREAKALADFEIFTRAADLLALQPEQPAALRREALELVAALGPGLVSGRDGDLRPALRAARRHCARLIALTAALIPVQFAAREPDLRALHGKLGSFLGYLEKKNEPRGNAAGG